MDLWAEFKVARARVGVPHCRWLKDRGVRAEGMFLDHQFSFGIQEIEILTDDSFAPSPGGKEAMVIFDADSHDIEDLVAFFPKAPATMFRRANALRYAGEKQLALATALGEPVMVHADLVEWMRWGFAGMVILDWKHRWQIAQDFRGVKEILVNDAGLGKRLRHAITQPFDCPPIMVPQ